MFIYIYIFIRTYLYTYMYIYIHIYIYIYLRQNMFVFRLIPVRWMYYSTRSGPFQHTSCLIKTTVQSVSEPTRSDKS